jgi:uncharacterized membrane protein
MKGVVFALAHTNMSLAFLSYNRFAGQNVERLNALSDGIFAVAMTLLVLDMRAPETTHIATEYDYMLAMSALWPRLLVYLMSFLTLGIFWVGDQMLLDQIERSDRHFTWLNLAVLATVSVIPFSTAQLATFIHFRSALFIYWGNLLAFGITVVGAWLYACKKNLFKRDIEPHQKRAFIVRVYTAHGLYALAVLSSLVFDTRVSIALIILIQLNYAIAPKFLFQSIRLAKRHL